MAHYTSVDDGYDVELYKSFEALWNAASGAHRHTECDEPLWLDKNESVRLTKAALRKEGYPYFVIDFAFLRQYVTLLQNRIS